jgi:hypothetical protein
MPCLDDLGPVLLAKDLTLERIAQHNLVVLGKNNTVYPHIATRLTGKGSFIEVVNDALAPGRDIVFVSDAKAAFYLANKRLYFKSGAYQGFFSFASSSQTNRSTATTPSLRHSLG